METIPVGTGVGTGAWPCHRQARVSENNLGSSRKVPVFTSHEPTVIEHVLLFNVRSPKYLLCTDCQAWKHRETASEEDHRVQL